MGRYDDIFDVACGFHGLITTAQAHELGASDKELSRLASSGLLERVGHGVYRVKHHVPSRIDQYAVAVACAGEGARLYGQSVLALLDLCPVDPRSVHVGVTRRVRRRLPPHVELHRVPVGEDVTVYEGVASQPVALAIAAARNQIMRQRLVQAVEEAVRRGLLLADERGEVMGRIDAGN